MLRLRIDCSADEMGEEQAQAQAETPKGVPNKEPSRLQKSN